MAELSQMNINARGGIAQQEGGLFQSFANMSEFSFAAMATASGSDKHAFGSRKDEAVRQACC